MSNKVAMLYPFEMKDRSSSDQIPVLAEILRKTINKEYRIKEMEDVQYFLLVLLEHVVNDTGVYDNPVTSTMACLEKGFSCNNLTESIVD